MCNEEGEKGGGGGDVARDGGERDGGRKLGYVRGRRRERGEGEGERLR